MSSRGTLGAFFLIEAPFYLSLWAIVRNWSFHFDGGWYVVIGHFLAVFATIEMIMFGVILVVMTVGTPLLFMLARMDNIWARTITQWIDRKFPPKFDGSRFKRPT